MNWEALPDLFKLLGILGGFVLFGSIFEWWSTHPTKHEQERAEQRHQRYLEEQERNP